MVSLPKPLLKNQTQPKQISRREKNLPAASSMR